jgi:hypothetical protein
MGDLMEWSPDEPMAGSLLHRYERAKSAVDKLEHTARVRNLIVNQLKTLSSSNPAYYRKVVDLYHHRAVSLKNMSDEEAKEIVIMGLTRLYNEYINRGTQASVDYPHESTGVYSLVNDEWLATPQREDPDIDWENVEKKANWLMGQIDRTQALFDEEEYGDAHAHAIRIGDKIKRFRQSGLEREGAFSPENVAFKVLRRNDYLGILSGLKVNSYDKKMSIPSGESLTIKVGNLVEKWKRHLNEEYAPEKKTTSHEISIRVAINKKTGLTKADTFANIRAIRGVTTVNVVPGTVADGLTSYYETLAIRFCCEPPADSNPGLYLKHSLMKGMKSVVGLTVVRTVGMPQEL